MLSEGRRCKVMAAIAVVALMMAVPFLIPSEQGNEANALIAAPTYTLTFYPNNGESPGVFTIHEGEDFYLPVTRYTNNGYYLDSWRLGSSTGTAYEPGNHITSIQNDMTFYAEWKQTDGTHLSDVTDYTPGDTLTINLWTKANQEAGLTGEVDLFQKPDWMTAADNGANLELSGSTSQPGVYYVHYQMAWMGWNPTTLWFTIVVPSPSDTTYTVTYDYGDSSDITINSGAPRSDAAPSGTTVTLPGQESASRTGHTLVGWRILVDGEVHQLQLGAEYTVNEDDGNITAEAYWVAGTNVVVFNTYNAPGIRYEQVNYGDSIKMTATEGAEMAGYTYAGWLESADSDVVIPFDCEYTVRSSPMMVGYWFANGSNTYTVTYDSNGGSEDYQMEIEPGMKAYLPETMQDRSGYVFMGWSKDEAGNQMLDGTSCEITSDNTRLYAQWRQNSLGVSQIQINGQGTVQVGSEITLHAYSFPEDADENGVIFNIINGSGEIIEVDQGTTNDGGWITIRGVVAGTATVAAVAVDGGGASSSKMITILGEDATNTVQLIYDANGGYDAPTEPPVNIGTMTSHTFTISQHEPQKDGYDFRGWADTSDATDPKYGYGSGLLTTVTVTAAEESKTLYAVWEQTTNYFTVTYDLNGMVWPGTNSEERTENIPTNESSIDLVMAAPPNRAGHQFLGWSTDPNADESSSNLVQAGGHITVTEDITIFAIWKEVTSTFTLSFELNGGVSPTEGAFDPIERSSATLTCTIPVPAVEPTKEGFMFLGWADSPSATDADYNYNGVRNVILQTSQVGSNVTKTVYAVWTQAQVEFKLTFNVNGGTGEIPPMTHTYKLNDPPFSFELDFSGDNVPVREGYTFAGWGLTASDEYPTYWDRDDMRDVPMSTANPEKELFAVWKPIKADDTVTLYFNPNGGNGGTQSLDGTLVDGEATITIPSDDASKPVWEGHILLGWGTTSSASGQADVEYAFGSPITITEDTVIFAVWEEEERETFEVTLTYSTDGGSNPPDPETKDCPVGGSVPFTISDIVVTKDGYTFLGWANEPGAASAIYQPGDENVYLNADKTLYAVWIQNQQAVTFTLQFDLHGGSGSFPAMVKSDYTDYVTFIIPVDPPTEPEGKIFAGWSIDSTVNQGEYGGGEDFYVYASKPTETLHAIWVDAPEETMYRVTFDSNGGTKVDMQLVPEGGKVTEPPVPEREGWEFVAWTVNGTDTVWSFKDNTVSGNLILTAEWTIDATVDDGGDGDDDHGGDTPSGGGDGDDGDGGWVQYACIGGAIAGIVLLLAGASVKNMYVVIVGIAVAVIFAILYAVM